MLRFDICLSPALYPYYQNPNAIIVVVDIYRATSSICTAFANGVSEVLPVETIEEALRLKEEGYLIAAERNAEKCEFADFGNSPFEFTADKIKDKKLVFTTTNGTIAINIAKENSEIIIGSFLNLNAVADYCINKRKDVLIICSGWNNKINIEDTLFTGALANILSSGNFNTGSDAGIICLNFWHINKNNILSAIKNSEHYMRLIK